MSALITAKHKPFMFSTGKWSLVVFAVTEASARRHAKRSHKDLKFIGPGEPANPEGWTAGVAYKEE